ncbi:MAG: hypothetical protein JWR61_751 [Ferruginibacter sp.]|uniref:hypothetical protein n=1 Tax=Ferruginibacter sp. TaxID=1940288 RepID=UPI0026589937|nr:hypothetical protein [Ferruginibacter sp.]MDB5275796.1 hypothetical protein [Ferruginibacter sp.]
MGAAKKARNTRGKIKKKQQRALPYEWQRIAYYFELLDEEGPAEDLWKILKLALIADNDHTDEHERSNMLFFYEYTKELFQHVYTLLQRQTKNHS